MRAPRPRLLAVVWLASCGGEGTLSSPTATDADPTIGEAPTADTPDSADTATEPPTTTLSTEEGELTLTVLAAPPNPLAREVTLTTDHVASVSVAYGLDGALDRRTPTVMVPANLPVTLRVLGLFPGEWSLAIDHEGHVGPATTVTTTALPDPPLPDTEVLVDPAEFAEDEAICAALEQPPTYQCTDREGRLTAQLPLPGNAMFVRPLSDGTFLAHPDGPDFLFHVDALGRELDRVTLDDLTGTTFDHGWIDEHEVIEITDGPWEGAWAVLTATEERVGGRGIIGAGLVVFDPATKQVLWDWSAHGAPGDGASIDPKLAYDRTGLLDYGDDWLHANAVVHRVADDGADTFWISLRHQDWIVCIEAPSGAVRWRLGYQGDFALVDDLDAASPSPLPDDQWFFHQHAHEPRSLGDGRTELLLFDNGNVRPDAQGRPVEDDPYSRALRLIVDEATMRASIDWSVGEPAPSTAHFFSPAAGDADRLYDLTGTVYVEAVGARQITDVTDDGTVRWRQVHDQEGELYRAEVFPSLYETGWEATTDW